MSEIKFTAKKYDKKFSTLSQSCCKIFSNRKFDIYEIWYMRVEGDEL